MELTYKTCWDCSKIKESEYLKYMQLTQHYLIYEFINKLTTDMMMQQWQCYTCPPFTAEMYCKAALKTYFQDKPRLPKGTKFAQYWELADKQEKDKLKEFLESAQNGKLPPIEPDYDMAIIDNIVI